MIILMMIQIDNNNNISFNIL